MTMIYGIAAIVMLMLFVAFCVNVVRSKTYKSWQTVVANWACLLVSLILFRYCFPWAASMVLYQGALLHAGHAMLFLAGVAIALYALFLGAEQKKVALAVTYGVVAALVGFGGPMMMSSFTSWQTAREYKFESRTGMIEVDKASIRYTPLHVAYNEMVQRIGSSESTVDFAHTKPTDIGANTGYMAPITPSGLISTFSVKNDGFMLFDDGSNTSQDERVRRVKQPFAIGEEMEWLDNVWRALYHHNPWTEYPDIFYVHENVKDPDKFVGVAPRIGYKLRFPLVWIPYWAGVTLFDQEGNFQDLTVEEAKADPRLKGKRIYPESLMRELVDAQRYDRGVTSGWWRRPGLIRLPDLPGENQQPFLVKEGDGRWYYMTVTEPSGAAFALFRVFYVDANSGARTVCEFDPNDSFSGPEKAIERVKALPGYKWVEEGKDGKEEGNFRIIEAIPIPMNRRLFWKYTITTKQCVGVVATAVVDAKSNEMLLMHNRAEFDDWLYGRRQSSSVQPEVGSTTGTGNQEEIAEIRKLLRAALERLDRLDNSNRLHDTVTPKN